MGITVNKNTIPFDRQSPFVTTRGFGPDEMRYIAHMIAQMLRDLENPLVHRHVADQVAELCATFPVPA